MKWDKPFFSFVVISCICLSLQAAIESESKGFAQKQFQNRDACVNVSIHSGVYTYEITNLSQSSITGFKVVGPGAFAIIVPDGWEKEITKEFLRATASEKEKSIAPQQTVSFKLYAIGKGSVLGTVPVHITFEPGRISIIDDVWAPVLEPRYYTWLVVICLILILIMHTTITIRRNRKETTDLLPVACQDNDLSEEQAKPL